RLDSGLHAPSKIGLRPRRPRDHKPIWSAFSCFAGVAKRHDPLDRNIPFLTSIRMSPFCVLVLASFFAPFFCRSPFSSKNFALGCPRNDDSHLRQPTVSPVFLTCWPGPGRSPAEPEGRSV